MCTHTPCICEACKSIVMMWSTPAIASMLAISLPVIAVRFFLLLCLE